MARSCCFCGQPVGNRGARYPRENDREHVMCGDCGSALDCLQAGSSADSAYRSQALNYFRQKLELGLVEPNMKDFLIAEISGSARVAGNEASTTVRQQPGSASAETTSQPARSRRPDLPYRDRTTFWIACCKVILILFCALIAIAGLMAGFTMISNRQELGQLQTMLPDLRLPSGTGTGLAFVFVCLAVAFVILCVGMVQLNKARDIHTIKEILKQKV